LVPGHLKVDFGDIDGLKKVFEEHGDRICGFLFEPIQGEAGVCAYHALSDLVTLTVVVDISYTVRN